LDDAQKELEESLQRRRELDSLMLESEERVKSTQEELVGLEGERQRVLEERVMLRETYAELEEKRRCMATEMEEERKWAEVERGRVKDEVTALEGSLEGLRAECSRMEQERETLHQLIKELGVSAKLIAEEQRMLELSVGELRGAQRRLEAERTKMEEEKGKMAAEKEELARSLVELRADVEGAEERSRVLSTCSDGMRQELARAEETDRERAHVLELERAEREQLMEEVQVLEKSVEMARAELTRLVRDVEARKLSLRQCVEVAQRQLVSDLRGAVLELRRLQDDVVDEGDELTREVVARRAVVAQVQREAANLAQSTASRAVHREQICGLEQRVSELKESLELLQDQHYKLKEEEEEMLIHKAHVQHQMQVLEGELLEKEREHQQQMVEMALQCQAAEQSKVLLDKELEHMRRDLAASRVQLTQASSELVELEASRGKLSEVTASLRHETDRLQQLERRLKGSIDGKHASLCETETLLAQRHEELAITDNRRGEAAQTLEVTEAKMEAAKEELRALKIAISQAATELQDQHVQEKVQRASLADLDTQRLEVRAQVDGLHQQLLLLQAAHAKQENRRGIAEKKASACQKVAREFVNDLEALKMAVALAEEAMSRHYTSTVAAAQEAARARALEEEAVAQMQRREHEERETCRWLKLSREREDWLASVGELAQEVTEVVREVEARRVAVCAEVEREMEGLEARVRERRLMAEEARKEVLRVQEDLLLLRADVHRWECSSREAQREALQWQQQAKDEEERVQDLQRAVDSKKGFLQAVADAARHASTALAAKQLEVEEATCTLQELEAKTLKRYEDLEQTQLSQEAAAVELERLSALQKQVRPCHPFRPVDVCEAVVVDICTNSSWIQCFGPCVCARVYVCVFVRADAHAGFFF
jgi:chromosome segregation ATPase